MNIYESAENYLEAILSLHERHGLVRSIDIANELHFSKPSVSVAMKKLRESGYIEMDKDGFVCTYTAASAPPSARQLSAAASSGASLQITGSETRLQPALSQSSAQVRIHSPSPQP